MKNKLSTIGAGTMGSGIAQIAASNNWSVVLYDVHQEVLDKSKYQLNKVLDRLIEKGRMEASRKQEIIGNILYTNDLKTVFGSNMVIEAIVENPDIKKKVFKEIESLVTEDCIIASNTSSLSITSLAAACEVPERFIGIHFFNPAPLMKLVEIIPAVQTSRETAELARKIIDDWGKLTVLAKDTPGFIVNKVARPFYSEALRIYEEGVADFITIDHAMKTIGGFRMGPFELMDFIGNDVNYTVTETVFEAFYYDPRYKPSFTQKRLSEAGYLGKKSGKGFYDYSENSKTKDPNSDEKLQAYIANRIVMMLINEAADTLHMNIASKEDIDLAMTKGVNYPQGLLRWADNIGIQKVVDSIDALYNDYHEDRYRCSPILRMMARDKELFFKD